MASNIKKKKKLLEEYEPPKNTVKEKQEMSVVLQKPKEQNIGIPQFIELHFIVFHNYVFLQIEEKTVHQQKY